MTVTSPHHFRHSYAQISSEQGADLYKISKSLGHSDIRATAIYPEKFQSRKNNASHVWENSEILQNIK
ncbi:tyrosine-type recombinase/integrase [Bacillus sp. DJP31]|uniref:tyrosine-type recombinase/integrase n=1 Tax=Bacillus sp. DJP31 TaxID=3409789 RepID=UPI003BB61845